MSTLYLTNPGSTLQSDCGRFKVTINGDTLASVPQKQIDRIVLLGQSHLTPAVISKALRDGIDIVYLTSRGLYRGRLQGEYSQDVIGRQAQYRTAFDTARRLDIARDIVWGKLNNTASFCARRLGSHPTTSLIRRQRRRLRHATSLNALRGYEGAAMASYFKTFPGMLKNDFGFQKRISRPPTDPINVLLSFGYSMLYKDFIAAIYLAGLDPYQGFLHGERSGHAALASDLMEEFRVPIVDALILGMVNRKAITESDFETQPGQCRLADEGRGSFIQAYSERLQAEITDPTNGRTSTWQRTFEIQARRLRKALLDPSLSYQPFHWKQ